jgi:uncharacterized protein YlxW (UPF0749 family)
MDSPSRDGKRQYVTCWRIQAWFLRRSRDNWKRKYMELKAEAKRLQNRVHDVTRSREQWREQAQFQEQQIQEMRAGQAPEPVALKKK